VSSPVELQQAPEGTDYFAIPKGMWLPVKIDGQLSARIGCPKCGESPSLFDHTIGADGTVTPSAVCPVKGCDFHEFVKLVGWKVIEW